MEHMQRFRENNEKNQSICIKRSMVSISFFAAGCCHHSIDRLVCTYNPHQKDDFLFVDGTGILTFLLAAALQIPQEMRVLPTSVPAPHM
jgi:hypothetical protein